MTREETVYFKKKFINLDKDDILYNYCKHGISKHKIKSFFKIAIIRKRVKVQATLPYWL